MKGEKGKMLDMKICASELVLQGQEILKTEIHYSGNGVYFPEYISGPKFDKWIPDIIVFANRFLSKHPCYDDLVSLASGNQKKSPSSCRSMIGILQSIIADPCEDWTKADGSKKPDNLTGSNKVFIVHGRDAAKRQEIENVLFRAHLEPIVLMEEASQGMTLIEKIESYADVAFAIVLYTACDFGRYKEDNEFLPRARQNVVFEHGYMVAHLGRNRVVALVEDGVETPGDLSGVVYISLNNNDWKNELFREMRAAGLEIQN